MWRLFFVLLLLGGSTRCALAVETDPTQALQRAEADADQALKEGEHQIGESHLRKVLLEGWLLLGWLEAADGRLPQAQRAFERAANSAVDAPRAIQFFALTQIRLGEAGEAARLLTRIATRNPKDLGTRSLLARALFAAGQPQQAIQELEEAHAIAPDDLELAFTLGAGYLRAKKPYEAERLFELVRKGRPIPETLVLLGRTYRDFGEYERARIALEAALEQDPRVRRAHYYLGMLALVSEGLARIEDAIAEFRAELKTHPDDPFASVRLGMALALEQRPQEALPVLERASRSEPVSALAFQYLGRCQLALDRPKEAAASLKRALELTLGPLGDASQLGSIHYQLALALRRTGGEEEAARHFVEAERFAEQRAGSERERLARYLADSPDEPESSAPTASFEISPLAGLAEPLRGELRRRVTTAVARAYLNLGVMKVQAQRFDRAIELLEAALELDPDYPRLRYSLGVAYFNAGQFEKAAEPLAAALAESPGTVDLKRMLALAWLNAAAFERAAELLRDDTTLRGDPSLQYAYGVALTRGGRAAEAQAVFSRLLAQHGDSPEVVVLLGQAQAQQGDFPGAIQTLKRALEIKPDAAQANGALGLIYLKQGHLEEAERSLRAELLARPGDVPTLQSLATVLDLLGRGEEALPLLRSVLLAQPGFVDSRYLLGKILLAQGAAQEAAENLEAAARLAPEDANVRYQLAQAYQKLGQREAAEREFEAFRRIKDKRRGDAS